jgi:hypothetical protein
MGAAMTEVDIEIEAYGVEVTPSGVALHVRTPSGEFHLISMPRAMAARLVAEIIFGLESLPTATLIAGRDIRAQ